MSRRFWVIKALLPLLLSAGCVSSPRQEELARDYYNLGNAYFELERFDRALEYYDRALQLDPSINQGVFNLARTSIEIGDFERALSLLARLEEVDPENSMVLEMIAYTHYRMGREESALGRYRGILQINPYNKRALYNAGLLETARENWAEAEEYWRRLIDLEDKPEYRTALARLAAKRGESEEAIALYELLAAQGEADFGALSALKDLYLEEERYYDAAPLFDKLLAAPEGEARRGRLFFERARMELLFLDDLIRGQEHLIEALKAGFAEEDGEALEEFVDGLDAVLKEQVEEIVREYS